MSNEEREKLAFAQPQTVSCWGSVICTFNLKQTFPQIAAASRIAGVTPSAILRLMRVIKQGNVKIKEAVRK
jgi:hypothetical protein